MFDIVVRSLCVVVTMVTAAGATGGVYGGGLSVLLPPVIDEAATAIFIWWSSSSPGGGTGGGTPKPKEAPRSSISYKIRLFEICNCKETNDKIGCLLLYLSMLLVNHL